MLNQQSELARSKIRTGCLPLVLVVDDNEDNIIYACASLELFNCQHIMATNAQAALDLVRDRTPDLILMDIVMPRVDGINLIKILKRNFHTRHIPVIAVTGLAFPHQKRQILNAGFDDYLCKPYFMEDLSNKLTYFLSPHASAVN